MISSPMKNDLLDHRNSSYVGVSSGKQQQQQALVFKIET